MVVCSCLRMERQWVSRLEARRGMVISRQRIQGCRMGKNTIEQAFKNGHQKSLSNVIHKFSNRLGEVVEIEVLIRDTRATNLTTTKGLGAATTLKE